MDNHNREDAAQQAAQVAAVFKSINLMSVGVAALLSTGMIADRHSVTVSVLSGVGFYGAIAGLLILWQPGALPFVLTHRQHEVTERRRDELQYRLTQSPQSAPKGLQVVEYPQIGREPSVAPARLPQHPSFVSPHADSDDSAKREAYAWVMQLYAEDGEPDPKKVLMKSDKERPGRVRIAAPSRPAKQWLMDHSILLDLGTGFRLNLVRCPTINAARTQLNLANGVPGSPTTHPQETTPLESRAA